MKSCWLVYLTTLHTFVAVYGTFGDFLLHFPEKLQDGISKVWPICNVPIFATPNEYKELLHLGKKRTTLKATKTTTIKTTTTEFIPKITQRLSDYKKVPIPILSSPLWRGMEYFQLMQIPGFALPGRENDFETRKQMIADWRDIYIPKRTSTERPLYNNPTEGNTKLTRNTVKEKVSRSIWIPAIKKPYTPRDNYEFVWN